MNDIVKFLNTVAYQLVLVKNRNTKTLVEALRMILFARFDLQNESLSYKEDQFLHVKNQLLSC